MERDEGYRLPAQVREPSGELLGPYVLLTEIARGELTTVHLAKKQGPLGFQRLVAVKRLRSEYAGQESCVKLLLDEAQLTAGLHHANLVGVLDVGNEGGCYVVSDYIEGENLERVLVRAGTAGHPRFVLPVLVDALNGLHAMHNAIGEDDQPLHMVHQAPSARHILIGLDGVARLTDFSQMSARCIAPSRVRSERLRVASMAPEQALDPEHVDHRADLFIVGITLWEALTGENLFAAESDERTFQNLLHRRIPRPSEVGMCPPRSFDAVCMRALERDPEARFGSALEMARELRDVALNQALYALPGEIGAWVKSVMGRELIERRRKLGDMNSQEIALAGAAGTGGLGDARREDPYLSGRIYGGSQSMAIEDDGLASDPDKTPVRERRGLFPIQRDEEPTAPRYLAFHSLNEVPRPPRRARVSTPPYGTFSDSVVAPNPIASQDSAVVERPKGSVAEASDSALEQARAKAEPAPTPDLDTERTLPNRVTSAPAFARAPEGALRPSPRGPGQERPGTYSHVAPSHRARSSRPPDARASGAASGPANPSFEDGPTGRHGGLPSPAPAAYEKASSFGSRAPASTRPASTASSLPSPPLPRRSSPALESAPPVLAPRRDSVPTRFSIPAEPVGRPLASLATAEEGLPKTFEALRTNAVTADGFSFSPPSSLSPPNTAERTLPPEALREERRSSRGVWWMSSALVAVILLAVGVGLRQRAGVAERSPATSGPSADGVLPAAQVEEPATPDQPSDDPTTKADAPSVASKREEKPVSHAAAGAPAASAASTGAAPRVIREQALSGESVRAGSALPKRTPSSKLSPSANQPPPSTALTPTEPAKAVARAREKPGSSKPKHALQSAIPDNPY